MIGKPDIFHKIAKSDRKICHIPNKQLKIVKKSAQILNVKKNVVKCRLCKHHNTIFQEIFAILLAHEEKKQIDSQP